MIQEMPLTTLSQDRIPVLMLARSLDVGGIESDVSKFARHLGEQGIEPHVATFRPGGVRWSEIEAAGLPLLTVPVTSFRSKSVVDGARVLRQYMAEHNIQVLHAFDIPADVYGVPLARMLGVPVTLSSQLSYRVLSPPLMRTLLAVVDRVATGVFVNCNAVANYLVSNWKVPRKRIHVCYNGYEPSVFHSYDRRRVEFLSGASTVIGTVALLRPEKNLNILIEAFSRLHRVDPAVRLVIVGSGPLKSELEQQAAALQVGDACLFQQTIALPAEWMRSMDVFVLPSLCESFSNALLEAMACGCCPVASRVGGSPELIPDGSGLLFESGDTNQLAEILLYLHRNPSERQRMGQAAAAFVREHLTIQKASARLANIYRELLGRSNHENRDANGATSIKKHSTAAMTLL